jgi:hypothetical protein
VWNQLSAEHYRHGGSYFDEAMSNIARERPTFLPLLQDSNRILIFSDFAGEHRNSRFATLSLVIVPVEAIPKWDRERTLIRAAFGLASRRIAYSKLNDRRKHAAIKSFCVCANSIDGICVTMVFDKQISSIFQPSGYFVPSQVIMGEKTFGTWKPAVFERALRAAYFVSLFVAGLSSAGQNIMWITDEDDIASNDARVSDLIRVVACFLGQLAPHTLGEIRIGTTANFSSGRLLAEDLAAIADLVAGAVNDLVGSYGGNIPLFDVLALAPAHLSKKARAVLVRLFSHNAALRKLIFTIEQIPGTPNLRYGCPAIAVQPHLIQLASRAG